MRFVLVHGGLHGAWCWDRLNPELRALGHDAIAVDLPGHGRRHREVATLAGYRTAVAEVLSPGDVLVGHSMGCAVATMAADAFPGVAHVVYLAGPVPVEGMPLAFESGGQRNGDGTATPMSDVENGADMHLRLSEDGRYFTIDEAAAIACFYHDCPEDLALWAYNRLTAQDVEVMVSEPVSVPRFWEADLPRSYIQCTEDRAFPAVLSERAIRRLGVEPLEIRSSHSPFLSRPAELASTLIEATARRATGPLLSA